MELRQITEYSTDIVDLFMQKYDNTIFLSSWDKDDGILNFNEETVKEATSNTRHKNNYIMSKGMHILKKSLCEYINQDSRIISLENITVATTGSAACFLSFLQIIRKKLKNMLFIGPIYFTYYQMTKIFDFHVYNVPIDPFMQSDFSVDELVHTIKNMNIGGILITNPLFSYGHAITYSQILKLQDYCAEHDILFIIDNVYGNMEWDNPIRLFNNDLIELAAKNNNVIVFDSLSKRIFLNGIKSAFLYGNAEIIRQIDIDTEICIGGLSYVQESLLETIFLRRQTDIVIQHIKETISYAQNCYNQVKTAILGSDFIISDVTCGYFAVLGIPKKHFVSSGDMDKAREILDKTHIITIPLSRYNYSNPNYYCFRLNLIIRKTDLMHGIRRLLDICSY